MSALTKRVRMLEAELGADWRKYHVRAQLTRFAIGVAGSVWLSIHSGVSDWTDILPLTGAAAWATAMQMWPQVPWWLVRRRRPAGPVAQPPGPPS